MQSGERAEPQNQGKEGAELWTGFGTGRYGWTRSLVDISEQVTLLLCSKKVIIVPTLVGFLLG